MSWTQPIGIISLASAGYISFQALETLVDMAQHRILQTPNIEQTIQQAHNAGSVYAVTTGVLVGLSYILLKEK